MNINTPTYPLYSEEELLNNIFKIDNRFNSDTKNEIISIFKKALNFAEKKHKEQYRDSWEAYVEHLKRTLYNVFNLLSDCIPREYVCDLIVATLLHDVIEDTTVTKEQLEKKFWKNVAIIVWFISKKPIEDFDWDNKKRKEEYKMRLIKLKNFKWNNGETIILKQLAALIKAGDRIDNLETMWSWSLKKIVSKIEETIDSIIPIYHDTQNKTIIEELNESIKSAELVIREKFAIII